MVTIPSPAEGKTLKRNPWSGTDYAKGELVIADNVPWDAREDGTDALSSRQRAANRALTQAAREARQACAGTRGQQNMVCRAEEVEERMEGRTYGSGQAVGEVGPMPEGEQVSGQQQPRETTTTGGGNGGSIPEREIPDDLTMFDEEDLQYALDNYDTSSFDAFRSDCFSDGRYGVQQCNRLWGVLQEQFRI